MNLDQIFDGWSAAVAPYALALLAASVLCGLLAVLGWRRRSKPGGVQFAAMMAGAAIWALFYALELTAPSLVWKVVWAKAEYIGIVTLPLTWFLFARSHTGASKRLSRGLLALVCLIPAITLVLAATNEFHGLLWSQVSLASGPFPVLALMHGPWFWVHMVYSYALLALGSFLLLRAVYRYPHLYRQQAGMLMVATVAPWVGNILFVFGAVPAGSIDLTPFAFAITGVALALSMSRFRLFSLLPALLPTARNQVLQTMKDGVLVLDVDGRVAIANPAASAIFCKQASDLLGKTVSEILDVSSTHLASDGDLDSQFEMSIGAGASQGTYDVVSSPLGLGGGIGVGRLLVIRDITERKRVEGALRESEEAMRYIVKHDPNAMAVYDLDLHYVAVSDRYLKDYNVKAQDVMGRYHYDVFPEMPQRWKDVHQRCLAGAIEGNDDDSFERPDGSLTYNSWECRPWYGAGGEISGIITYTEVTTERKQMEEQLRLTQLSVSRSAEQVHWIDAEGRILYANEASCRRGGYSLEEMLSLRIFDLDPTLTPERWKKEWQDTKKAGSRTLEAERRTKAGESYPVEVAVNYVEHGGKAYAFAFVRDITERVEAERALRERDDQLRQSQKMEAVGQLAGGIAHDFNNLLTAIIGNSSLALASLSPVDSNRELISDIKEAGERAAGLTRQILAFSRRQILRPKVLTPNEVVVGLESLLRRTLGEDIDLNLVLAPNLSNIEVDLQQIEQVLINLAVNARDAMNEGGRLTIETAGVKVDRAFHRAHPEAKTGPYVMLSVTDSGCGMDEETVARIFEPFFTTKEVGKGTGLGLSTAFGIVRQSGGTIAVSSEPEKGSTFRVYLPAAQTSGGLEEQFPTQPSEARHGSELVLVVEDEATVRELVVRVLSRDGYRVLDADTLEAVERVLDGVTEAPDLLLTDVVLPGGASGKDVADTLVGRYPQLRVIFMSGYTRDAVAHDGRLDEGIEFLEKPFVPETLLAAIRSVLDGKAANADQLVVGAR